MQAANGAAAPQSQASVSKVDASKVWALAASTQDDDILDDDELLTEEDQRPPVVPGTLQYETGGPEDTVDAGWCQCTSPLEGSWALAAARGARCTSAVGASGDFGQLS